MVPKNDYIRTEEEKKRELKRANKVKGIKCYQ